MHYMIILSQASNSLTLKLLNNYFSDLAELIRQNCNNASVISVLSVFI